uniref:Uncharacterized protein n=1 Tax=Arundo donax TaxID=35708 RepID=A0A0A8ZLC1_ARUDO
MFFADVDSLGSLPGGGLSHIEIGW